MNYFIILLNGIINKLFTIFFGSLSLLAKQISISFLSSILFLFVFFITYFVNSKCINLLLCLQPCDYMLLSRGTVFFFFVFFFFTLPYFHDKLFEKTQWSKYPHNFPLKYINVIWITITLLGWFFFASSVCFEKLQLQIDNIFQQDGKRMLAGT